MRVLILTLDLQIPGCRSLKERRGIMEPLKSRLRRDLKISVSEVEPRHLHDRVRLGIASVVDNRAKGDGQLCRILAMIEREHRVVPLEQEVEYW